MSSDPTRTGATNDAPRRRAILGGYRDPMTVTSDGRSGVARAGEIEFRPLGHVPALDGIRALAVAAVLAFHGDVAGTSGGFLGVSMFFTLSGFLITSLLLREWAASPGSGVDLRRFFSRRFRRLLPASWLTIAIVLVMGLAGIWETEQLRALRGDVPWALAELVNWHFIAQGTTYGASQTAPSPLEHFWSLAIEQQFYVLLPLLLTVVLVRSRRAPRSAFRLLVVALGVAMTLSALANGLAARSSIDRAYFGTDTRAAELLVGALLACVMLRRTQPPDDAAHGPRSPGSIAAGFAGLAGLVVIATFVHVARLDSTWLYPWGLLATAVATSAVVVASLRRTAVAVVLATAPLILLGRISYGVYLLHWPIFLWLNEARTGLDGAALFALRVLVSLGAATALYHLVEMPIRSGRRLQARHAAIALPVAAVVLLVGTLWTTRDLPPPPGHLQERDPGTVTIREAPTVDAPDTSASTTAPGAAPAPTTAPASPPARHPQRVLLVGDSVAASLEDALGDAMTARGITFATAAGPGCGVITGDPADERGVPLTITTECDGAIPPHQRGAIDEVRPDLVVTLSSWESADRIVDGRLFRVGTPESDEVLRRLYDEMIGRLGAGGAAVALATMPDPVDGRTRVADPDVIRRLRHVNTLLPGVAAAHPGRVTTLPFDRVVCPDTPCPTSVDGVELRPVDGAHFDDPPGARLAAERLADMIAALDLDALP